MNTSSQFVSYEIAVQLKKLGFDEQCLAHYRGFNPAYLVALSQGIAGLRYSEFTDEGQVLAPLWQQVIDWLRTKHSIYITVLPFRDKSDEIELCWYYSIVEDDEELSNILCNEDDLGCHGDNYDTYEEARLEAITKAIELCVTNS